VRVRLGVKPGQWGWSFAELHAAWRTAEEAGFDYISCFDRVTAGDSGMVAWDAPSLLIAMAAATRHVELTVEVLNASLRHPFMLAGQLAIAQAVSGGRLRVGLGAGSYRLGREDHEALGIPFPPRRKRIEHLAACCRVLPALWRGEEVNEPSLGLETVSLGPTGIEPPQLIVGGESPEVMKLAAEYADGWQAPGPQDFAEHSWRIEQMCRSQGRDRPLEKGLQVFVDQGSLDGLGDLVQEASEAGASRVTFVLHRERGTGRILKLRDALAATGTLG
jgi:alkanesulfonate monooxygenase SsuD/methylene tetrahydromethanopterin reductase-like flavin-dependent oxidoreductase (luciferase family)